MGRFFAAKRIGGELLMADYLTTDTELTTVADAIRTKGGTSAALEWPSGFAQAIADIPSGGGVETATVSLYSVGNFAPSHIYYTDEDMTVQHTTDGSVIGTQMPIGSIVYCYGSSGPPASMDPNVGLTELYVESSPKSIYAAYEVTS